MKKTEQKKKKIYGHLILSINQKEFFIFFGNLTWTHNLNGEHLSLLPCSYQNKKWAPLIITNNIRIKQWVHSWLQAYYTAGERNLIRVMFKRRIPLFYLSLFFNNSLDIKRKLSRKNHLTFTGKKFGIPHSSHSSLLQTTFAARRRSKIGQGVLGSSSWPCQVSNNASNVNMKRWGQLI